MTMIADMMWKLPLCRYMYIIIIVIIDMSLIYQLLINCKSAKSSTSFSCGFSPSFFQLPTYPNNCHNDRLHNNQLSYNNLPNCRVSFRFNKTEIKPSIILYQVEVGKTENNYLKCMENLLRERKPTSRQVYKSISNITQTLDKNDNLK